MGHRPFYPRDSKSTVVLVLGILSLILIGFIAGIPAIFLGIAELGHIKTGISDPSDRPLVITGLVLGIVGTLGSLGWMLFVLSGGVE